MLAVTDCGQSGFCSLSERSWRLYLLKQGLPWTSVVGDFDSVSDEELMASRGIKEVIQAQLEKDDVDLELAVLLCFERYPDAYLTIFGALAVSSDHALANVFLPSNDKIAPIWSS